MKSDFCVVLWAYARPEFTNFNVRRLVGNNNVSKLIIVHDGLRKEASRVEKESYYATRQILTSLKLEEKVDTLLYEDNVGFTQHFFRVADIVLKDFDGFINHEDDKVISPHGLQELHTLVPRSDIPLHLDTRGSLKHIWKDFPLRNALFVPNGVSYMNRALVAESQADYARGVVDRNRLLAVLMELYGNMFLKKSDLKRVVDKIAEMLSWGISNPDRPDSLLAYSLLIRGRTKLVTNHDLSLDVSHLDFRGKNQEYTEEFELCYDTALEESSLGPICRNCEIIGAKKRVPIGLARVTNRILFSIDKATGYGRGPRSQKRKKEALAKSKTSGDIYRDLFDSFGTNFK